MKNLLALIFIGFLLQSITAQKEAANWYFGFRSGLDFNSGTPIAVTNGALSTTEGCATISDFNGNLLFYTDGTTVWNRNHQPMPNGNGLAGHPSSTQSGIIVPNPGNPNLYYIFTVDDAGGPDGLQYNIVDITLDGGLGDITTKNVVLHTPVTEKVTAVAHTNGSDIWVISHEYGSDKFLAYLVSAAGINASPVVSAVGLNIAVVGDNGRGSRGYLKVSPNGEYLASASGGREQAEIFRFNTATGIVSNPIELTAYFPTSLGLLYNIYGVEFSPDSSKLYISTAIYVTAVTVESNIHQFDISTYTAADILNSGIVLGASQSAEIGALQLGLDGKIYVAQYDQFYLGAINSPNTLGIGSDYVQNAVSLSGRRSSFGLPPFIQSYFVVGVLADNFCLGDATEFSVTADASNPITSISWDFGDGNSSTLENPTHTYASSGTYTVNVQVTTATDSKTETKEITIYEVPVANSTTNYEVCTDSNTYEFDLSSKNREVLGLQSNTEFTVWYYPSLVDAQNGMNKLPDLYTNTDAIETVYARVFNASNPSCFDITSFNLILQRAPVLNIQQDWTVCNTDMDGFYTFDFSSRTVSILENNDPSDFTVSYYLSQLDLDNKTNPLPINYTNTLPLEEIFYRVENNTYSTCYREGTFHLEVISGVTANSPSNFEVCDTDNDGFFTFDLSTKEVEILGTQNAASVTISFHATLLEAENAMNPLNKNSFTNTTPYSERVFVRIENSADTSCYDTNSLELQVSNVPVMQMVTNWQVCDDNNDGAFSFNLNEKTTEVLGDQLTTEYTVTYHNSLIDAQINQNNIVGDFTNTTRTQTIFVRLESNSNSNCFITNNFDLQVYDTPVAYSAALIEQCDTDESGTYVFDLSPKDAEILNGQDAATYVVSYFESEADAIANQNPLLKTNYQNTSLQEVVYARVQHNTLKECYDISNFEINIRPLPQPILEEQYVICPDSPELSIDGGDFESWMWRDAQNVQISTDRILNVTSLGEYTLSVSYSPSGISCEKTVSFEVVSSGAPEDFTTDIKGFSDLIMIEVNAVGIGDFEYSTDGENFQDSNRLEVFPGTYTIYVRDKFLCRTITKEVIALGFQKFFTPNGDGIHEYWNIIGVENFPNSQIYIFDRQGKMLKQLSPESSGWDGTFQGAKMPASDYWFRFINEDGNVHTGHFSLKR